jgi:alpha-beta hydrolase superfamily lysophospholipase
MPDPPAHPQTTTTARRRVARFVRRRPKTALATFLVALFLALNGLAFVHAWSMTHFVAGGWRMPSPQALSMAQKLRVVLTGVRLAKPTNTMTPATFDLPYTIHHYRGADGTEYEAWRVPAGGPPWRRLPWLQPRGTVLLFHGYVGCKAGVLEEAEVVRRAGYDAFLVDFRGSGGSSGSSTTIGYREADDVAEAVRYVQKTFSPTRTVIYGRSMGAAAALRAVAARNVRPDALVVESPFDRMLTTVDHRFSLVGVPTFPLSRLLVFWGGVQHGYWAFRHNPVEYARSVSCPTLMIRAGRDPFVRPNEAESIFANLKGAKRMLVFEGASHQACVDVDPRKWEGSVTDFLLAAPRGAGR